MTIKLERSVEQRLLASIQRYFEENMDEPIGELKASLLLDYFLREIGPSIYNQAISDAQTYMQDRVGDMDGTCHEPDPGYWKDERKRG